MRRATTFLAALAIKQNSSHIAIEILSSLREARYIQIRCLKILAYTDLKRFTEIVPMFRASLEHDRPNAQKESYFIDVVCILFIQSLFSNYYVYVTYTHGLFLLYLQIEKLEETMAQENIPENFELYKLIALLKKDEYISPKVSWYPDNPFLY